MSEMTVGELEKALFAAFPREDAESWDQPGLSVGDRSAVVGRVAVNLDQTVAAVLAAADAGCNVLVTHHPPFIKSGPKEFGPSSQAATPGPGRLIYEAARLGVNVIAMHTNADRSLEVRDTFAELLGCSCEGNFEQYMDPRRGAGQTGFGAVLVPEGGTTTLADVARRCVAKIGGAPRVWGEPDRELHKIAFLNGSWDDPELYSICQAQGIDCMIVGETRYHGCIDAQPFLSVIELGHDRSELPIVGVLAKTLEGIGIDKAAICDLQCSDENWWTPGTEM